MVFLCGFFVWVCFLLSIRKFTILYFDFLFLNLVWNSLDGSDIGAAEEQFYQRHIKNKKSSLPEINVVLEITAILQNETLIF